MTLQIGDRVFQRYSIPTVTGFIVGFEGELVRFRVDGQGEAERTMHPEHLRPLPTGPGSERDIEEGRRLRNQALLAESRARGALARAQAELGSIVKELDFAAALRDQASKSERGE